MLLLELQRHADFLASRIGRSGRRSRDLAGEKAELQQTRTLIAALVASYGLPQTVPPAFAPVLSSEEPL